MAKKNKTKKKKLSNKKVLTITKEQLLKMDKTAHRNALKETGQLNIPKHKVHKNDKDYVRKPKHKKPIDRNTDLEE